MVGVGKFKRTAKFEYIDDHEWSRLISLALALVVLSCLAHAL